MDVWGTHVLALVGWLLLELLGLVLVVLHVDEPHAQPHVLSADAVHFFAHLLHLCQQEIGVEGRSINKLSPATGTAKGSAATRLSTGNREITDKLRVLGGGVLATPQLR